MVYSKLAESRQWNFAYKAGDNGVRNERNRYLCYHIVNNI